MEPEFVLNGVEYCAVRVNTGFYGIIDGPTVWCVMKYPKLAEPDNVIGSKKKIMQIMAQWLPSICIFMIMLILFIGGPTLKEIVVVLIITVIVFIIAAWYFSKK